MTRDMTREALAMTREDSDSRPMTRDSTQDSTRDSTVTTRAQLCYWPTREEAVELMVRSKTSDLEIARLPCTNQNLPIAIS